MVKVAETHDPKQPSEKPVLSGSEKPVPVSETGKSHSVKSPVSETGHSVMYRGLGNLTSKER
jgi:hypothetical protein